MIFVKVKYYWCIGGSVILVFNVIIKKNSIGLLIIFEIFFGEGSKGERGKGAEV